MCSAGEIEDGEDVGDGKDVGDVGDGEGDVGDGEDIFVCVFLFPKTQHYHIHCFYFLSQTSRLSESLLQTFRARLQC